jgi:peptidoglycan/LPS O-acetylase OafA/YrhL
VDQFLRRPRLGVRFLVATGLGLVAIAGSVALVVADGVGGGIRWAHHSGVSAAPLLLVAGAIAAVSVARPARGRRALMQIVAVLAFTAWGVAQLFPDSGAAGVLNDLAILLFVVDAGCAVITEAGVLQRRRVPGMSSSAAGEHGQTDQPVRPLT